MTSSLSASPNNFDNHNNTGGDHSPSLFWTTTLLGNMFHRQNSLSISPQNQQQLQQPPPSQTPRRWTGIFTLAALTVSLLVLGLRQTLPLFGDDNRDSDDENSNKNNDHHRQRKPQQQDNTRYQRRGGHRFGNDPDEDDEIHVAFLGNSILYFNDCPRLLEHMLRNTTRITTRQSSAEVETEQPATTETMDKTRISSQEKAESYPSSKQEPQFQRVVQNSCLRGGANITSLWDHGNGMQHKFATPNAILTTETNDATTKDSDAIRTFLRGNNAQQEQSSSTPQQQQDDEPTYDIGAPNPQTLLEEHEWDFLILNDHTQAPIRNSTRTQSIVTLTQRIAPLLMTPMTRTTGSTTISDDSDNNSPKTETTTYPQQQQTTILILLQTFAYKVPLMRGTQDLPPIGYVETFTDLLQQGYQAYQTALLNHGLQDVRIAPVGQAVLSLYQTNHDLWQLLYSWDDFHPSPLGTWLEACVLYATLLRRPPPRYNPAWWNDARRMQPPEQKPMPLPTPEQAEALRQVAMKICHVVEEDKSGQEDSTAIAAATISGSRL